MNFAHRNHVDRPSVYEVLPDHPDIYLFLHPLSRSRSPLAGGCAVVFTLWSPGFAGGQPQWTRRSVSPHVDFAPLHQQAKGETGHYGFVPATAFAPTSRIPRHWPLPSGPLQVLGEGSVAASAGSALAYDVFYFSLVVSKELRDWFAEQEPDYAREMEETFFRDRDTE